MATIHIQVFDLSCWLKIKSQIQWPHPNLLINTHVLRWCKPFNDVSSKKILKHLNPWISWFPHLLDQFRRLRSVWKWDFVKSIGRYCFLNVDDHLQNHRMKSPWFGDQLDYFECYLKSEFVFSYNIKFQFWVVDWVNFRFNFLSLCIRKFYVIFALWYLHKSWSKLSYFWFSESVFESSF